MSKSGKDARMRRDPLTFESCESAKSDILSVVNIDRVHVQLSRLAEIDQLASSSRPISITAITREDSKVYYDWLLTDSTTAAKGLRRYIMCECGLEAISVKFVGKSSVSENAENDFGGFYKSVPSTVPSKSVVGTCDQDMCDTKSTGVLHINQTWLSFAAPAKNVASQACSAEADKQSASAPSTLIDWNLLNTVTDSVTVWLTPIEELRDAWMEVCHVQRTSRNEAVFASLMAVLLDSNIHPYMEPTNRHERFTAFALALRNDPSFRLCSVLVSFLLASPDKNVSGVATTTDAMHRLTSYLSFLGMTTDIPCINVLEQGLVVLARQWKNSLFAPFLTDLHMHVSGGSSAAGGVSSTNKAGGGDDQQHKDSSNDVKQGHDSDNMTKVSATADEHVGSTTIEMTHLEGVSKSGGERFSSWRSLRRGCSRQSSHVQQQHVGFVNGYSVVAGLWQGPRYRRRWRLLVS